MISMMVKVQPLVTSVGQFFEEQTHSVCWTFHYNRHNSHGIAHNNQWGLFLWEISVIKPMIQNMEYIISNYLDKRS